MNISDLYSQFDTSYKNAKLLVKQNEHTAARDYLIACMSVMLEIYKNTNSVIERAKLYAHICEFKSISAMMYDNGITPEIKAWFGIEESETVTQKPKSNPSQIDKIISDDSIDWAAEVFAKFSNSVVEISAKTCGVISSGTGFIISDKGYLLTNDHVVFDEKNCDYYKTITMKMQCSENPITVEVVSSDKKWDVALCRFDASQAEEIQSIVRIKDYSKLLPGAYVLVIGNGLSMGLAPFTGNVKFPHDNCGNLVTTVPSNHGDSGGPVFNRKGECVGINKSIVVSVTNGTSTVEAQGITNATPMDKIDELLTKWCKKKSIEL